MSQTKVKGTVCEFIKHPHYDLLVGSHKLGWLYIETCIVDEAY